MQVTLIAAQSLDGYITQHDIKGTAFTSPEDKAHFAETLFGFDASIMGGETYRVARDFIRTRLTASRCRYVLTRNPDAYRADQASRELEFTDSEPAALIAALRARGHQKCALLGGAQIHSLFLNASLVDRLMVTIEPRLFGGGTPFLSMPADVSLTLKTHGRLGNGHTLVVEYEVLKKS